MQFQLPSNLQSELIAYDPALKKLVDKQKEPQGHRQGKKSKYPVGNPPCLIPSDVVRPADLQEAIDGINTSPAAHRYHAFRRPSGALPNLEYKTHAVIYHWEGLWVAAWLPPVGKEDEYVYGYSHCYKDTASAKKMLRHNIANDCSFLREDVNRSSYMVKTAYVTKQMITDGNTERHWFRCRGYGQKGRHMGEAVRSFEKELAASIPSWSDSSGIFDRLRDGNTPFKVLFPRIANDLVVCNNYFSQCSERYKINRDNWTPTVDSIFTLVDTLANVATYRFFDGVESFSRVRHILDKPFFRKFIQSKCDEIQKIYNDPSNKLRRSVGAPYLQIVSLAKSIRYVNEIWPDFPIDYVQSNLDALIGTVHREVSIAEEAKAWLRSNMPVASYFQILSKFYSESVDAENKRDHKYNLDSDMNCFRFRFSTWDDTVNMLEKVLVAGKTIETPKRWRLTEFHDHVQEEAWKIANPNQGMPQDLFPSPVKVELDDKVWTFFQPIDTHQLSQWGQAVRNCVGNASSYAEGVKKKKHFIVLCMVDAKPTFTVQLEVSMSLMSVKQIVAVSNRSLSEEESESYTKAFSLALHAQEERLKSGLAAS